jgi:hypothetical protein
MAQDPNSSFELFIHKFPAETPKPLRQVDYLSHLAEPVPPFHIGEVLPPIICQYPILHTLLLTFLAIRSTY